MPSINAITKHPIRPDIAPPSRLAPATLCPGLATVPCRRSPVKTGSASRKLPATVFAGTRSALRSIRRRSPGPVSEHAVAPKNRRMERLPAHEHDRPDHPFPARRRRLTSSPMRGWSGSAAISASAGSCCWAPRQAPGRHGRQRLFDVVRSGQRRRAFRPSRAFHLCRRTSKLWPCRPCRREACDASEYCGCCWLALLLPWSRGGARPAGAVFLGPGPGLTGNDTGGIIVLFARDQAGRLSRHGGRLVRALGASVACDQRASQIRRLCRLCLHRPPGHDPLAGSRQRVHRQSPFTACTSVERRDRCGIGAQDSRPEDRRTTFGALTNLAFIVGKAALRPYQHRKRRPPLAEARRPDWRLRQPHRKHQTAGPGPARR